MLARLLEPLAERLERADRGAAVHCTSLRLTSRTVHTRTLQLPAPMRDPKTLRTLILLDLESHPPDAPIDIVRVFIEPTPARVLQWTLFERAQPAPEQVSTLIARLTALMGERHVGSPRLVDTWRPGAFTMADFRRSIGVCRPRHRRRSADIDGPQAIAIRSPSARGPGVPALPFADPDPRRGGRGTARARLRPIGKDLRAARSCRPPGPWRTSGEWWDTDLGPRQPGLTSRQSQAIGLGSR